ICCILESLPSSAKGYCLIEIPTEHDFHPELKHPGFEFQWLINPEPEKGSTLATLAKEVQLPSDQSKFAYVACEYSSVKDLRTYFKDNLGWSNKDFYAFAYWKAGVAEDKSAQDRREEKAE